MHRFKIRFSVKYQIWLATFQFYVNARRELVCVEKTSNIKMTPSIGALSNGMIPGLRHNSRTLMQTNRDETKRVEEVFLRHFKMMLVNHCPIRLDEMKRSNFSDQKRLV